MAESTPGEVFSQFPRRDEIFLSRSGLMSDFLKVLRTSAGAASKCELIPLVTSKAAKTERRSLRVYAVQEFQRNSVA